MTPSEPVWELRNAVGVRTLCYITLVRDGCILLVQRDAQVIISEHHDGPRSAMDRAGAIYTQLTEQGWIPVAAAS